MDVINAASEAFSDFTLEILILIYFWWGNALCTAAPLRHHVWDSNKACQWAYSTRPLDKSATLEILLFLVY